MTKSGENLACRVCGRVQPDPPWGENGKQPSFDICVCCGTQFGYEDCFPSGTTRQRKIWLDDGAKWFNEKEKPANWDLEEQLKNIPPDFR